jgi:5'-nucleotidase
MRLVLVLTLALLSAACATPRTGAPEAPVTVGIVAINDFHGNLEPPKTTTAVPDGKGGTAILPSGGAAWLASAIDSVRARYEHHITVSAGDLIGASPIASSLFLDEPTIGVMNRIGLDLNAVGNHEFDSGTAELRRKQAGGCEKHTVREPCALERFAGAKFAFLAANVMRRDGGGTLFPGTALRSFGKGRRKVTLGFIGMTLEATSTLVPPQGIAEVTFADEVETANALVPRLKAQGADAIVLLIHEGGYPASRSNPDGCEGLAGPIRDIVTALDPRIDLVVSGHSHQAYVCDWQAIDPARPVLLTSAGLWGKLVSEITVEIEPASGRVVGKRARNVVVQSQSFATDRGAVEVDPAFARFEPRADIAQYVARYVEAASAFSGRKAGSLAAPAIKTSGADTASGGALGNLVADAQLAATRDHGAQIAFTNPFGLRTSLVPRADGSVTFGDIYAVQPFNNELVTMTLTGEQIRQALEQGFDSTGPEQVLSASQGFAFAYDRSRAEGGRIVAMTLDGMPIDPAGSYRVTVNAFLANGGDTFRAFMQGAQRTIGPLDIDALESWLKADPPGQPPPGNRATDLRPDLNPAKAG